MSLSDLLSIWRETPGIAANIVAWRTFPAQAAQTRPLPEELHPRLAGALRRQGIERLYTHQAKAWQAVQAGQQPVIVTGTASGKTLGYNLPVVNALLNDSTARAIYLFPTKALAYDQLGQLVLLNEQLAAGPDGAGSTISIPAATYDGDTPPASRAGIRANARLVLTNPDMLHTAILPHHTKWAGFLGRLRFVVLDEMHIYRGVFGSHVANVLRRLKRVARFYGAAPQFILTSATIANPTELAGRLVEGPTVLVDQDGAAKGTKHFLIYNPPVVNAELGLRRSVLQETVRLGRELLQHQTQTIIFGRTRRTVELLLTYLREQLPANLPESASSKLQAPTQNPTLKTPNTALKTPYSKNPIRAYRSGYLPRQRREIERGLRDRRVQAVVATSALELGIDIGTMGAALLAGYPGTIAGAWQQAGRAGRRAETALAILIASASPLDQFLAHHPDYFFGRSPEQALINPDNLLILLQHLRCAAFELPFQTGEAFGGVEPALVAEFLRVLQESGDLYRAGPKYFWMADRYPAEQVSLRSASPHKVRLQAADEAGQTTIGEVDLVSAPWLVHPQAIYLHEGQSFLVEALDLEQLTARLKPSSADYYTEPKRETTVTLIELAAQAGVTGGSKHHGDIMVTSQVVGYRMVQWFTHERLGDGEVDLPPSDLPTTGYWLALAAETVERLRDQGVWRNDPNDYGPNWPGQRHQARARDGYRCQICGVQETDRQHDVHHKIPFRTFASYREANQLANLITLCRPCHRRAETAVRMRSGLTGLATALGQLAPLFLMCDAHDVGLHAEPEAALANGQPAVIIYDRVPAGIGFSQRLFDWHDRLMLHAYELVGQCPCADGCPSCVGPAGEQGAGGKKETLAILSELLEKTTNE